MTQRRFQVQQCLSFEDGPVRVGVKKTAGYANSQQIGHKRLD